MSAVVEITPISRQIPEWDLSSLFESDTDPRIQLERHSIDAATQHFVAKWQPRTDYLTDPAVLVEALDEYETWAREHSGDSDAEYYFTLRTSQDQSNSSLKAEFDRAQEFGIGKKNEMRFFTQGISQISAYRQQAFLDHQGLAPYKHFLERKWAEAKYLLSEKEERIIAEMTPGSYDAWTRLRTDLIAGSERETLQEDGGNKVDTYSELLALMQSKKKDVRDAAAVAFNDILTTHLAVAEAELNAVLRHRKTVDKLKGYERPDTERHVADDIDTTAVDAMLEAVVSHFDIPQRYYALKAHLLGQPSLEYHERDVEYGNIEANYPLEQAVKIVYTGLRKLNPQFGDTFRQFIEGGQVDALPRKGKVGGAFCWYNRKPNPVYILLNHTGRLNDVLTMGHETGHGVNNEYMRARQNQLNFGTSTATAEVASTFMEDFVLQELLEEADDETRLAIMMMKLNTDIKSIFRQVACYRFEQQLHAMYREKGYLSKDDIGSLFQQHMAAYIGNAVEQSAGSENWWVYWPHIRLYFYVYSYASGLLISKSLQRSVKDDPGFIDQVKEFLASGVSKSPKDIFTKLGIDITDPGFWQKGLSEVEALLTETEQLARKLGKIE